MRTIIQLPLVNCGTQTVQLPEGAETLDARMVFDVPSRGYLLTIWAIGDKANPTEPRSIRVVQAGVEIPDGETWRFLGTSQTSPEVWHIFEVL